MAVDCTPYARKIYQLAMNLTTEESVKNLDDVLTRMQQYIPEIRRESLVDLMVEATTNQESETSKTESTLAAVMREVRLEDALRNKISALQEYLETGTLPEQFAKKESPQSEAIKTLKETRDALKKELSNSLPAVKKKLEARLKELNKRLRIGDIAPHIKVDNKKTDAEIERLNYQIWRKQKEIRHKQAALKPKTNFQKVVNVFDINRAIKTAYDLSGFLRQGGFVALAHPIRSSKAIIPMLEAFRSEENAYRINEGILNRPNAPMYARHKLFLAAIDSTLGAREEAFRGSLLEVAEKYIPGLAASDRAYTTVINQLRADSFDAMIESFGGTDGITSEQADAIANFVNIATGRGDLGRAEGAAEALNIVLFAARYSVSRFQLLTANPIRKGKGARGLIIQEYARYAAGLAVLYALAAMAGGDLEDDPRSSDFGKVRFGNTRLDPISGMSQVAVILARIITGEKKSTLTGEVQAIRGPESKYGRDDVFDTMAKFARSKFSPLMSFAVDHTVGKNYIGEDVYYDKKGNYSFKTHAKYIATQFAPLALSDIYDVFMEQEVPQAVAMQAVALLGVGMQTYGKHIDTMSDRELYTMLKDMKLIYKVKGSYKDKNTGKTIKYKPNDITRVNPELAKIIINEMKSRGVNYRRHN